jgi:DNA-binding NarL/FixJ family response regulator
VQYRSRDVVADVIVMRESSAVKRRALQRPRVEPIRLVIVAPDRLVGEALGALLGPEPGVHVTGTSASGLDAVALVDAAKPDVVLLDPGLTEMDSVDVIRLIVRQAPATKVLLLTTGRDGAAICRALRAGAKGYVSKRAGLPAVTEAVRGLHRGDMWVEPSLIAEVLWGTGPAAAPKADGRADSLTAREREILGLLAGGGTNRHIAEALFISEKTVKTHLHSIFRKLNVKRRLQAVLHAPRLGLRRP